MTTYLKQRPSVSMHAYKGNKLLIFKAIKLMGFSLNVFTEFTEFSDKKNKIKKIKNEHCGVGTQDLLCKRQR